MKNLLQLVLIFGYVICAFSQKPNIVLILTDDQDLELNSLSAMPKLLSLVGDKGATFTNAFVSSPLCCPSRAGILTGKYVHNHGTFNNSAPGGCGSISWQNGPEQNTFPVLLNNNGYSTFFTGKYLNTYGNDDVGGLSYVPPGWDSWYALQGNSVYYDYYLSVNGTPVYHGNDSSKDYLTNVMKNESVNFIETYSGDKPFFMMLATPACHKPFTPEPKYENSLNTSSIPKYPNFNIVNVNKNWFLQLGEQPLRTKIINDLETSYQNRLRTLMTVDDMVESVIQALENRGFLNDTYIFYTSDNGYHLGQFSLPMEKNEPYEFDIRVPLLARGPGISEGILIEDVTTNIDLAPTFLNIAGVSIPALMDGISLKDYMINNKLTVAPLERSLLIEHSGEGIDELQPGCNFLGSGFMHCDLKVDCKCFDARNNTYNCIRTLGGGTNELYCAWEDYGFEEYYNITSDPYEITNIISSVDPTRYNYLSKKLNYLMNCSGSNCNDITVPI